MSFPAWNASGVIPAVRPGVPGHHQDRSPYRDSLSNFFDYFCFSAERIAICKGLLAYRDRLHQVGLIDGFQWLNGSFSEYVETTQSRAPNDVDVVTFFAPPPGFDQAAAVAANPDVFDQPQAKSNFRVDAYFLELGLPQHAGEVRRVSYWYSMWSHRRDGLWKGFIQIDLDPSEDSAAVARLQSIEASLAGQ